MFRLVKINDVGVCQTRHINHRNIGLLLSNRSAKGTTVHPRHFDVRHHKVKGSGHSPGKCQGTLSIVGFQDLITLPVEHHPYQLPNRRIVIGQKDNLTRQNRRGIDKLSQQAACGQQPF